METCKTCMYWQQQGEAQLGYCRERPPLPDAEAGRVYPLTDGDNDWCGYYDPPEPEKPEGEVVEPEPEWQYWKRKHDELQFAQARAAIITGL